ncbi:MAG: 6-phosphofructokinase, partial [Ardenticatenaceae bacterium]
MQSGGCTPVLNRSLFGVVREAGDSKAFGEVYGAAHGIEGILAGNLIPLSRTSDEEWNRIADTPAAALGSTRRKLRDEDVPVIFDALAKRNIPYWFIIGGNDSAETGHNLVLESKKAGYDLTVMNVPKTIDNDLVLTDHCPGYGSAARFVALATMGASRDAEAMGIASPITIIEVMGRDAGWLAAAAALAKQEERDGPHFI